METFLVMCGCFLTGGIMFFLFMIWFNIERVRGENR